jgi:hypothetical protein
MHHWLCASVKHCIVEVFIFLDFAIFLIAKMVNTSGFAHVAGSCTDDPPRNASGVF